METNNTILKTHPKLKRKRPYESILPLSHLIDYEYLDNDSASSSPESSTSSISGNSLDNRLDFGTRRNPHKILVTEEKMADALRDLQLQATSRPVNVLKADVLSESESDSEDSDYYISDELRRSIQFLNSEKDVLNKLITSNQTQLQLIPYIPFKQISDLDDNCSDSSDSNHKINPYKVEEPIDNKKKNLLKRKYSQLNKITIEELKQNDQTLSNQGSQSGYVVEFEEDKDSKIKFYLGENDQAEYKFNFADSLIKSKPQIIELNDQDNSVVSRFNKSNFSVEQEEAMEI